SQTTAAAAGALGVVRRDPFAMLPFCGYNMGDYFSHWLKLGDRLRAAGAVLPRIFCVNWFQTDDQGKFIWPGYGENMRVLKWMLERIQGTAQGEDSLFGVSPRYQDITWDGLDFSADKFKRITTIDPVAWRKELDLRDALFDKLKKRLPAVLSDLQDQLRERLKARV
ncbi:MAG TPA: phosphoenolpyruvate carboxykinase domain-containing protein, partial [Paralcaligenes sp.]